MITINNTSLEVGHFPDGTQMILHFPYLEPIEDEGSKYFNINWKYENDEEMVTLMYVVNHLRTLYGNSIELLLYMGYIPNARMDRVKNDCEVFTLKYFCNFINSLNFKKVYVTDPHSNVSTALLNNVVVKEPDGEIMYALLDIDGKWAKKPDAKLEHNTVVFFPDAGAMKRYRDLPIVKNRVVCYGQKVRDWNTGKILSLNIFNEDGKMLDREFISGKIFLMVDDIISYGGTMAYSADKLKENGALAVYAYATHTENSVLNEEKGTLLKRLENGIVDGLYTTGTIFNSRSKYVIYV